MNLIAWLLFGAIVGLVGYALETQENERRFFSSILLGMGGALLGGIFANTVYGFTLEKFNLTSFLLSVSGSLALLLTGKTLQKA